jgi:membrane protease YdiL (CAAX protease family)
MLALFANLRLAPRVPLFLLVTVAWLCSFFLALAGTAGVVEEAAFRGYMLSQVQRRHGWIVAITLVGALFYVVHLSHAYPTIAFLPFFAGRTPERQMSLAT